MNVKDKLKELGIKLIDFASELDISRPTLDNYISMYERGQILSNDKYQCIFESLFNDEVNSKEDFLEILNNYHNLIKRDKILGTLELDAKRTDLMTSILERMKKDLDETDFDESIYTFINLFIGSYRKTDILKSFARYFLLLNDIIDIEEVGEKEKPFISNCYKLMNLAIEGNLQTNESYYQKFIKRVNELKEERNNDKESLKERIIKQQLENKLNEMIQEQVKLGIEIKDIDIDEVLKKIDFSN